MRNILLIFAMFAVCPAARAAEDAADLLAPYIDGGTYFVASAHIERDEVTQLAEILTPLMVTAVDREGIKQVKLLMDDWTDRRLYAVCGLGEMPPHGRGPLVILPALPGEEERSLVAAANELQNHLGLKSRHMEGHVILAADEKTLDRYEARQSQDRPDLTEPLAELLERDEDVAIVVSPGADARRVLREMWPSLDPPFDALTGALLADGIEHVTLAAELPPEWSARLTVATADQGSADTIGKLGTRGLAMLRPLLQGPAAALEIDVAAVIEAVAPQRSERVVRMHLSHEMAAAADALTKVASLGIRQEFERSRRMQRMNDAKQLALGLLNFESAHKSLPASAAICDAEGKPLLSWRVAILPFLEEGELFNEFRLDEPWDSEHNRPLIDRMPEVFADPARPDHQGRTTWQVPVHAETVFPPTSEKDPEQKYLSGRQMYLELGTEYRDITDGTSNTILLVSVAPERAVPWTKPVDWEVDLDSPLAGLQHDERNGFTAAFCDGHARHIPLTISAEKLRAFLTRAGREVVDD